MHTRTYTHHKPMISPDVKPPFTSSVTCNMCDGNEFYRFHMHIYCFNCGYKIVRIDSDTAKALLDVA